MSLHQVPSLELDTLLPTEEKEVNRTRFVNVLATQHSRHKIKLPALNSVNALFRMSQLATSVLFMAILLRHLTFNHFAFPLAIHSRSCTLGAFHLEVIHLGQKYFRVF